MYRICFLIVFFLVFVQLDSCGGSKKKLFMPDSTRWTDQDIPLDELDTGTVNSDSIIITDEMKQFFLPGDSLIEGRPVSFYLNRRDVSQTARDFYLLRFIPSDDEATYALCDSILTKNDTTRRFYYFLFIRLMRIADGGLAEGMSDYALKYFLKFPQEFYARLKNPLYKQYYNNWVEYIASTLMIPNNKNPSVLEIRNYILQEQIKNIKSLSPSLRMDIISFADTVASMQIRVTGAHFSR
jgi:hypothetical protein